MTRTKWLIGLTAFVVSLGLAVGTADAKPKKNTLAVDSTTTTESTSTDVSTNDKFLGGSDPTNIPVVDDDLEMSCVAPESTEPAAITGRGVIVAVLDGGFNLNHPDIAHAISSSAYDALDEDADPMDLGNGLDDDGDGLVDGNVGHGTFVAGMVLLAAPGATILPIRIRDDEGLGTNDVIVRGIEHAVACGAHVINLSVQLAEAKVAHVDRALKSAAEAGVLVVVSAGNEGLAELERLGWEWFTLPVGAVDSTGTIASFSNYSVVDTARMIFAPGVDLVGPIGAPTDDARGVWSGTSFAAGTVSGAAALARERFPVLTLDEWRALLETSVTPVMLPDGTIHPNAGCIDLDQIVGN